MFIVIKTQSDKLTNISTDITVASDENAAYEISIWELYSIIDGEMRENNIRGEIFNSFKSISINRQLGIRQKYDLYQQYLYLCNDISDVLWKVEIKNI